MTRFAATAAPLDTKWGAPVTTNQVLPGVWHVTTADHGGYVLSDERQAAVPEALRRDDPFYEEDVDWALVLLAFAAEFRRLPTAGIGLQVENARRSVRAWHPDRYAAFTGEEVPQTERHVLRRRAAYQAVIGEYASTSASRDWADWVPTGMVGVVFRRVASVDALGFARYAGNPIYGLVTKDRYADRSDVETFDSLGATQVESTAPITKEVAVL